VIAKSDLIILLVSSSLLGVAIYRWDQNTRNVNTSTVLANTQVAAPASNTDDAASAAPTAAVIEAPVVADTAEILEAPTAAATDIIESVPIDEPADRPYLTHVVRSGDSLSEIASDYNTSVRELRELNGISGSTIYIGQEILYPAN